MEVNTKNNMVNFFILLKHFANSYSTAKKLAHNNVFIFFNIFIIRFFYSISFFRNRKKFFSRISIPVNNEFFTTTIESSKIQNDLVKKGFNDLYKFNSETILKILDQFKYNKFRIKSKNQIFLDSNFYKDNSLEEIIQKSIKNSDPLLQLCFYLQKTDFLYQIATGAFYDISKQYLQSGKITLNVHCFISNPITVTEEIKKKNAQYFHYDCDYRNFLKIFIYLTDVDKFSGPHVFIEGTHRTKKFNHILAERIDDKQILENYPKENYHVFCKEKGSIIFEDTFGLHKGTFPEKKSRVVMIFEYGVGERIQYDGNEIFLN